MILFGYFSGKFGRIRAKILRTPKILPALTCMLNGIYFSHKQKKETHFDYNAEDDTIGQWFSNFSLLRNPFTAPKTAAEPFVLSKFF